MIIFLAGMEAIPNSFYEAAVLDGANLWHQFWKITIPLLWDTMQTAMVYVGLLAFDMFAITQVMVVQGSSTTRPADVLATYLYEQAFSVSRFGYATAICVAMFILMLALSVLTMRLTRRESVEF
jgi:N-acetylglucosamine transport system permease protein